MVLGVLLAEGAVLGEETTCAAFGSGFRGDTSPQNGCCRGTWVNAGEPVEKKAGRGNKATNAGGRLARASARLAQANLLQTEHRGWRRWSAMLCMEVRRADNTKGACLGSFTAQTE